MRAPNPLPRPRTSAKSSDYDANLMSSDDASADTDDEWERNIPQTAEIEVYLYLFHMRTHVVFNIPLNCSTYI